jgi:predicted ribosomally synthesized peptide with SipW-like signal peptide
MLPAGSPLVGTDQRSDVNASSTKRIARRVSVAKVMGSVGIVGAAAAVAGLGTFGAFTDSTEPAPASIQSGIVSIDLAAGDGTATVPLAFDGVVPGASVTRALNLANDGDSDLSAVRLTTVATESSVLDTDAVHGLQMTVLSCPVAWTSDFTCAVPATELLAPGPVIDDAELSDPASLTAGATDHLAVTLSLPASAGDAFKDQSSALALTFTATQRAGATR